MALPLRLMSYNPLWPQEFEQSRSLLLWATAGWVHAVEHIGSTALPECLAQPVVDLLAGMQDLQGLNAAAELIEGLNYARLESPEWCADELTALLVKPRRGPWTHSVLLVRHDGPAWKRALAIRQRLTNNLHDRQLLQNLKRDYFSSDCHAAVRYAAAKAVFFQNLEQQIADS
ncbi:MAG: GrpB family protein [Planctomycetales bacterium]|nr:GrpB family protein [Planctomycetales bacterium]